VPHDIRVAWRRFGDPLPGNVVNLNLRGYDGVHLSRKYHDRTTRGSVVVDVFIASGDENIEALRLGSLQRIHIFQRFRKLSRFPPAECSSLFGLL